MHRWNTLRDLTTMIPINLGYVKSASDFKKHLGKTLRCHLTESGKKCLHNTYSMTLSVSFINKYFNYPLAYVYCSYRTNIKKNKLYFTNWTRCLLSNHSKYAGFTESTAHAQVLRKSTKRKLLMLTSVKHIRTWWLKVLSLLSFANSTAFCDLDLWPPKSNQVIGRGQWLFPKV